MWLYFIAIQIYILGIKIASLFSEKAKKAIEGRKNFFKTYSGSSHPFTWVHCSSLGEFEQGRPLIELIKKEFPEKKVLLSFFSPSGYEMRKNYHGADVVVYLPFDTPSNAQKFLLTFNIEKAIFIKYDVWPFYIKALLNKKVPVYLVSTLFRENHFYFRWYGSFYKSLLKKLNGIFVQNQESFNIASNYGFENIEIAGDMRIDRVADIKKNITGVEKIEKFLDGKRAIVCGSIYPNEITLLKYLADNLPADQKLIIAPHNTDRETIDFIHHQLPGSVKFEQWNETSNSAILIIDHIGSLNRIYKYSSCVYIGGGFGKSVHNILEPAVFGIPVFYGPNFSKFPEASQFIEAGIGSSYNNQLDLGRELLKSPYKENINDGKLQSNLWFSAHSGATQKIFKRIFLEN